MQIVFIHGFNSSQRSFNYLVSQLPVESPVLVSYSSHQPLRDSIQEVRQKLPKEVELAFVGHSLGGVLAVLMAAEHIDRTKGLVCISAPLGGSKAANTLRWLPGHPRVVEDITPTSGKIELISQLKLKIPTLSIISTGGSLPISNEPNDSIVTVSSQRALPFGKKVEVKANHFEILLADETVNHVRKHLLQSAG